MPIRIVVLKERVRRLAERLPHSRGQGLIETALLFPVLLIVLSSLVEFGFLLNEYMAIQDAARNTARFQADGSFIAIDNDHNCATTRDFYRQAACLVYQELAQERPEVGLDFGNGHDDVIVSSFSIAQEYCTSPATFPPVPRVPPAPGVSCVTLRFPEVYGEAGGSAALDQIGSRNQSSRFTIADVNERLDTLAPSTGLVLVEIFYDYDQKLKLPWITAFIPDPILLHNYTIMPLVSAEPTPTPEP